MIRIACVGDNCIDYYDNTNEAFPGGNPVNVAVYARRLGADASYLGAVGTDKYGELMICALQEKGVDTSHVQVLSGNTALTHVCRVDGERIFGDYEEGVMAEFSLNKEDIDFMCTHDLVVSALWGRVEGYLQQIHQRSIPIAFDCADRPFDKVSLEALPHTDIAFFADDVSDEESLRQKILQVASFGPKLVVATRGIKGSLAYDGQAFYNYGIVKCDVGDTMGAGDSFIAGFLTSWLQKKSIRECMAAGAASAAVTISYCGAW